MPSNSAKKPADVTAALKERNEYIPSFISKKPFYVDDSSDTTNDYLEHQRLQKTATVGETKWYDRGKRLGPAATKFRKGACENCGAMTHKAKDCLSRPRKKGAKWTGKDIQADEVVEKVHLDWDAKRDRWNGYDADNYRNVIAEYDELERMKKSATGAPDGNEDGEEGTAEEGAKYEEETDMGRQQPTSTRNLRIREDTAKYLLNLDLDSAKYDPKTRSMVDSGATADQAAALVAEEGFMKASGDAADFEKAQRYAWETQERGGKNKIHLQANPTSGEFLRKKEADETDARRAAQRQALFHKYGGEEHLNNTESKNSAILESERYTEYDELGKVKGAAETKSKSKYVEDVLTNNHTAVWGSWWSNFRWGYACCHSTVKNSYCTGEQGKEALKDSQTHFIRMEKSASDTEMRISDDFGSSGNKKAESVLLSPKSNTQLPKRGLLGISEGMLESEMEDYRRKRHKIGDPMVSIGGKDEFVH